MYLKHVLRLRLSLLLARSAPTCILSFAQVSKRDYSLSAEV